MPTTHRMMYDMIYVPLLLAGFDVDMAQLDKTYNTAFISILEAYNQVEFSDKSVLSIACSIDQDAKTSDTAIVRLILATRGLSHNVLSIFDTTDNWRVWENLGKCDGTCVGDDHTTILKKSYNSNRPLLECQNGRLYYTNIAEQHFIADGFPENNPNIQHYNYGFRLWCGYGYEVDSHCVEYQEMQYYYNNLCQIMANEAWRPEGHVTISIKECDLTYYVSVNPQYFYSFCCYYLTGKPNCTNEPPAY